jgi:hypothetical protein
MKYISIIKKYDKKNTNLKYSNKYVEKVQEGEHTRAIMSIPSYYFVPVTRTARAAQIPTYRPGISGTPGMGTLTIGREQPFKSRPRLFKFATE